jgi:hypothetical protein
MGCSVRTQHIMNLTALPTPFGTDVDAIPPSFLPSPLHLQRGSGRPSTRSSSVAIRYNKLAANSLTFDTVTFPCRAIG